MVKMKNLITKNPKGFTLVELVIVIAIVIILSVISVPIYRGYIDNAKWAEGYALLGAIVSSQKAYYSEYGNFLYYSDSGGFPNCISITGVDPRGNKYFTWYYVGNFDGRDPNSLLAGTMIPKELPHSKPYLNVSYNVSTGGVRIGEGNW